MSARRAFVWLLVLTLTLLALTVVVHYVPLPVPEARPPVPANGIVVPSSDTPTLTAGLPSRPPIAVTVPPAG